MRSAINHHYGCSCSGLPSISISLLLLNIFRANSSNLVKVQLTVLILQHTPVRANRLCVNIRPLAGVSDRPSLAKSKPFLLCLNLKLTPIPKSASFNFCSLFTKSKAGILLCPRSESIFNEIARFAERESYIE